ncbi:hypothetical protein C7S16_7148 [Burkholderia thailandensis]|uniref:Uncharacterized protein n=1 Tax=Burkholderia thailandensis TaxID=57975 RepID=A0AAW9CK00_BURTH|nr:hypothetical protein [Burkholderia thailandensis]MDW9251305.1 hypothetical protein [Burkholderia thailandensis]
MPIDGKLKSVWRVGIRRVFEIAPLKRYGCAKTLCRSAGTRASRFVFKGVVRNPIKLT